jgi:DNA mismatch repair ATPase MutS
MAGIPHHAADGYTRLIRAGRKVAVCEQMRRPPGKLVRRRWSGSSRPAR